MTGHAYCCIFSCLTILGLVLQSLSLNVCVRMSVCVLSEDDTQIQVSGFINPEHFCRAIRNPELLIHGFEFHSGQMRLTPYLCVCVLVYRK